MRSLTLITTRIRRTRRSRNDTAGRDRFPTVGIIGEVVWHQILYKLPNSCDADFSHWSLVKVRTR
jgi:hypothetical protein